jgi:hypothetical protein
VDMYGSDTRYYSVVNTLFFVGAAKALVRPLHSVQLIELDGITHHVFAACNGAKTLEQHHETVMHSLAPIDARTAASALIDLVQLGLLADVNTVDVEIQSHAAVDEVPTTTDVVILTCERPVALRRCLASLVTQISASSHCTRVIIIDGSQVHADATRAVVRDFVGLTTAVEYWGHTEVARLYDALKAPLPRCYRPEGTLRFSPIGAGRTLALLLTAGCDVVMIDDDVLWDAWISPERHDGLDCVGHDDPRKWRFFRSRPEALASLTRDRVDILAEQRRVIGRSLCGLASIAGSGLDLQEACKHVMGVLTTHRSSHIKCTFMGLAGDSAQYSPLRMLLSPALRRTICADDDSAISALESREVSRIVRRTTVTHDSACMGYTIGLANRSILPPFIPNGRNEDGLFGTMVLLSDPSALFAHLPVGVVHDSDKAAQIDNLLLPAGQTRIADLLNAVLQAFATHLGDSSATRLSRMGALLVDIGQLPYSEFRELIVDVVVASRCRDISAFEGCLEVLYRDQAPARVAEVCREYVDAIRRSLACSGSFVPAEFASAAGGERESWQGVQSYIREFGELLTEWPSLWSRAADLRGDMSTVRG